MKNLHIVVAIVGLVWYGCSQKQCVKGVILVPQAQPTPPPLEQPEQQRFVCDGRTRCPQMTSCEEATFFINNCPGTQMDGDNDGVPCESQWCGF